MSEKPVEKRFANATVLRLVMGDITKVPADAIVNAANSALAGGGGVDGAIHRAGGPAIMRELKELRPRIGGHCPPGSAVATGAGDLPAKYVFHAVGPMYEDGNQGEAELLRSCYETCLKLAAERNVRSITFPAISAGAYGYPADEAARIAIAAVSDYLSEGDPFVREVTFVLFGPAVHEKFIEALASHR